MSNQLLIKQTRDRLVRDLTSLGYPMSKSEVRRTLDSLLELQRQMIVDLIIKDEEPVIFYDDGVSYAYDAGKDKAIEIIKSIK